MRMLSDAEEHLKKSLNFRKRTALGSNDDKEVADIHFCNGRCLHLKQELLEAFRHINELLE